MVWIFYYAEQVAEVLQRDMFEDGKHLWDPQCPWRCQVGGDLQLQGHAGWPRGWPCARDPRRSCRPQTTHQGPCAEQVLPHFSVSLKPELVGLMLRMPHGAGVASGWLCCMTGALGVVGAFPPYAGLALIHTMPLTQLLQSKKSLRGREVLYKI